MSLSKTAIDAQGIVDKLRNVATDAKQKLEENKEIGYGIGGAGLGALLTHYMTDPDNRSMAAYLIGGAAGAGGGALIGRALNPSVTPPVKIQERPGSSGMGDTASSAGAAAISNIPFKGLVKFPYTLTDAVNSGVAESLYKAKHGKYSLTTPTPEMDDPETRAKIQKILNNSKYYFNPSIEYDQKLSDIPLSPGMAALSKGSKLAAYPLALGLLMMGANSLPLGEGYHKVMGGAGKSLLRSPKYLIEKVVGKGK